MSEPPIRLVCETFIPGKPATKGSLDVLPNGQVKEGVKGSKAWRLLMTKGISMDRRQRGLLVPEAGPVGGRAVFFVDGPAHMSDEAKITGDAAPTHKGSGDLDKLARNLLDAMHDTRNAGTPADVRGALVDSFALVEDVQVVRLVLDKVFCTSRDPWGVFVQCWTMTPETLAVQRELARAPLSRVMTRLGIV